MDAFEKLEVWKRSCRLSVEIYKLLAECKDYGFKDQLFRSALSVPSNIAEGYERGSRKEYIRFLNIAKGSCGEMRTQLYIGIEASIISRDIATQYLQESSELSKMLQGLISKLVAKAPA
jgi:four helix bundle protein